MQPGAVLARVAASHLRVGTFQYRVGDLDVLRGLAEYTIARHDPELADAPNRYLELTGAWSRRTSLVARWS